MAGLIFKPLSNELYSIPKAQILFKPLGAEAYELLGDADDVTVTPTVEQTDRYTNESGIRTKVKTIVTQIDAVLAMTLVQLSNTNRALSLLGEATMDTQIAAVDQIFLIEDADYNDKIYKLPAFEIDPASVVVTDGNVVPVDLVLNVHYRIDVDAGFIQLIAKPVGSDTDVSVTFDALAVTAEDGRAKIGIASKTENRGSIIIRGTNETGPRVLLHLHDVQLRPSGERSYISETELDTIAIEGSITRDDTQESGYELGYERLLK